LIHVNRVGVLLDWPSVDGDITMADAEKMNMRPYLVSYKAESIINWDTAIINGRSVLSMVVLREHVKKQGDDMFEHKQSVQYRVLMLDENGNYVIKIYSDNAGKFSVVSETTPTVNGAPMKYIPFWIISEKGFVSPAPSEPILLDLADLNLAHYRNSADHEENVHWVAAKSIVLPGWCF